MPTILLSLAGCTPSDRSPAPWLPVGRGPGVRVSVDTLHVDADSVGTGVTIRFDYSSPQRTSDSTPPFVRVQLQEYLDCPAEQVRDIDMAFFNAAGAEMGRVPSDSANWVAFRD